MPDGADPAAEFQNFYMKTTKSLVAFLLMQGASLPDAADITQDTMMAAYRRWHDLDHPRAWAYRVASRALIRRFSNVREEPTGDPLDEPRNPLLTASSIDYWEQEEHIASVLAFLPSRQRQVMAWCLAGYTATEIADELRMTPEAVRSSLRYAKQALTEHLGKPEGAP